MPMHLGVDPSPVELPDKNAALQMPRLQLFETLVEGPN